MGEHFIMLRTFIAIQTLILITMAVIWAIVLTDGGLF